MSAFTDEQRANIRGGYHPDCGLAEVCAACGATEAPGGGACPHRVSELANDLWVAAIRHDHNADPQKVLHVATSSDAELLDRAARAVFATALACR